MRLAIFSDVHANIEALSAVMEAYKSENVDRYFCIGDVVGYGASPNECCDVIRGKAEITIPATTTRPWPGGWTTRITTRPPATRSTSTPAF
jgi:hypothetical protein